MTQEQSKEKIDEQKVPRIQGLMLKNGREISRIMTIRDHWQSKLTVKRLNKEEETIHLPYFKCYNSFTFKIFVIDFK